MKYEFKPVFQIGQHVYLFMPDSDLLLITNITFDVKTNLVEYEVMYSNGNKGWYSQVELCGDKIFNPSEN